MSLTVFLVLLNYCANICYIAKVTRWSIFLGISIKEGEEKEVDVSLDQGFRHFHGTLTQRVDASQSLCVGVGVCVGGWVWVCVWAVYGGGGKGIMRGYILLSNRACYSCRLLFNTILLLYIHAANFGCYFV